MTPDPERPPPFPRRGADPRRAPVSKIEVEGPHPIRGIQVPGPREHPHRAQANAQLGIADTFDYLPSNGKGFRN